MRTCKAPGVSLRNSSLPWRRTGQGGNARKCPPESWGAGAEAGRQARLPQHPRPTRWGTGEVLRVPVPAPRFLSKRDLCSDMQQNLPFQPRLAKQARESHVVGDAGNARSACRAVIPDQSHRKAWEVSHRAGDGAELGHRDHGSASGPRDSALRDSFLVVFGSVSYL